MLPKATTGFQPFKPKRSALPLAVNWDASRQTAFRKSLPFFLAIMIGSLAGAMVAGLALLAGHS